MRAWPLLLILFAACATTPVSPPAPVQKKTIVRKNPPTAPKRREATPALTQQLNQEGIVILDVRSVEEFFNGHVKGAQNIDFLKGDFEQKVSKLDKTKHYLLYCASGNRAGKARQFFLARGLKADVLEPFDTLKSQGAPIEGLSP